MKSYIHSKLFWTGIATVALALLDAGYQAYTGVGDFRAAVLVVVGTLVIVLRKYTSSEMVFALPQKTRQLQAQRAIEATMNSEGATGAYLTPEQRRVQFRLVRSNTSLTVRAPNKTK